MPLPFQNATADEAGTVPAYETTLPCDEKGAKARQVGSVFLAPLLLTLISWQTVAHMEELKAEQAVFLRILLSLHYDSQLLTPCSCGVPSRLRKVACSDCLQAELLCRQCWMTKHRTMPTHWALVWNAKERFFEKHDFCRVMKNASVGLGHSGERCPEADPAHSFTLVATNGIHATALSFCRCKTPDGRQGDPDFQQLLRAGIFPGSIKEPKTGYTLGLLEYYRQLRNQGKGSAYNFVRVLQQTADPFFEGAVPVRFNPSTRSTTNNPGFRTYITIFLQSADFTNTSIFSCDAVMHTGQTNLSLAKSIAHTPIARKGILVSYVRHVLKEV